MKKLLMLSIFIFASQMFVACSSQAKIEKERQQQLAEAERVEAERVYQHTLARYSNWQANFEADEGIDNSKTLLDSYWEAKESANVISQSRVVNSQIDAVEAKLRDQQAYEQSKTDAYTVLDELKANNIDAKTISAFEEQLNQELELFTSEDYVNAQQVFNSINKSMASTLEQHKTMKEKSDKYVVQKKDTLWSIAEKHPITRDRLLWPYILKINQATIKTGDDIQVGQTLLIQLGSEQEMEAARAHAIKREGKTPEERMEEDRAYLQLN